MTLPGWIVETFEAGLIERLERNFPKADVEGLATRIAEQQRQSAPFDNPNAYLFGACRREHLEAIGSTPSTAPRHAARPPADPLKTPEDLEARREAAQMFSRLAMLAGELSPDAAASQAEALADASRTPGCASLLRAYAENLRRFATWADLAADRPTTRPKPETPF